MSDLAFDIYFYENDYRSTSPQKLIKKMKPLRSLFPCGEVSVFLPEEELPQVFPDVITIYACIYSSDDIMTLTLITSILREKYSSVKINLFMPYLPYGRQDRICANGEAFSLDVFAYFLNMHNYDNIITDDAHNEHTSTQLIRNLVCLKPLETIESVVSCVDGKKLLVYPDKGAYIRYGDLYNFTKDADWTYADKTRLNGDIKLEFGRYASSSKSTVLVNIKDPVELPVPSKLVDQLPSPVNEIFLAVCSLLALLALPAKLTEPPVKSIVPSSLNLNATVGYLSSPPIAMYIPPSNHVLLARYKPSDECIV